MAQDNSNSTLEMGTSDQVLVATKRKKTLGYVIGTVAMLVALGVVLTLIIVLSGGDNGTALPVEATTRPPTPLVPIDQTLTPTTTAEPTTEAPATEPPLPPIDLEEMIDGVYSPPSFNASWSSGHDVLFRNTNGDLVLYDVDTDSTMPLIYNTSQYLQRASRVMQLSSDGNEVILACDVAPVYRYSFFARYTAINIITGAAVNIIPPDVEDHKAILQNFVWAPQGTALAFVFENNIYYQESLTDAPRQITLNGEEDVRYHGIPDWVYEEEVFGSSNAIYFSKDGKLMAFVTFDDSAVKSMTVPHYGIPGHINFQYTQHHTIRYPKPGTINPSVAVTLLDVSVPTGGVNETYGPPNGLDEPILKTVKFVTNQAIAIVWTNRIQTMMRVQLCSAGQTTCSDIYSYDERNGWIDNIPFFFNEAGTAFITILPWFVNGELYKQIVEVSQPAVGDGSWTAQNRVNKNHTVLEILAWNSENVIWYKATSVNDSAEQHIYTVNSIGEVNCFTCNIKREDGGECLYNEATISTSGDRITINCAGPDVPQVFIYNTNGSLIRVWDESADLRAIAGMRDLPVTIRTSVPVGVGLPDADVHIQAPHDYMHRTNVPLLVYVYGGPDTALVTKQWSLDWGSSLVSRWGIAIAHIDGRGSGLRGVSNMFALYKKLGTVEIQDQITVTKHLQDNLSWIDGNRTCIWGWSYGGYAATKALAEGGDVFRCAVAVAPVVDWRFYDTIYTERYMEQPQANPDGYRASSLLTSEVVENLRNKSYFLIHGTADDNVHYQHAMLLSRQLQTRDVPFTQMSYTDEDHGLVGVRPHLYHALEKFLQDHML